MGSGGVIFFFGSFKIESALPKTNSKFALENWPFNAPKGNEKVSYSNHPIFSGATFAGFVSGRVKPTPKLEMKPSVFERLGVGRCFC